MLFAYFLLEVIKVFLFIGNRSFCFLREMDSLINVLVSLLSFLPSAEVVTGKMHYFEEGESAVGFRLTSVLSILIFPYLSWSLIRRMKKRRLLFWE